LGLVAYIFVKISPGPLPVGGILRRGGRDTENVISAEGFILVGYRYFGGQRPGRKCYSESSVIPEQWPCGPRELVRDSELLEAIDLPTIG
jgi:hypothetical protein